MSYSVLIVLHAAAGLVAFVVGIAALSRSRFLRAYRWSMAAMAGFLLLAIGVTAGDRDAANWLVSGGLLALAGVMVLRTLRARPQEGQRDRAYVHHVGFGLVGLFDAFWVVALMRAGAPGWLVAAVAVGVAVAGHLLLTRIAARSAPNGALPEASSSSKGRFGRL